MKQSRLFNDKAICLSDIQIEEFQNLVSHTFRGSSYPNRNEMLTCYDGYFFFTFNENNVYSKIFALCR